MNGLAAWPALVLAAGLGTRLGALSGVRAKAALPVAGRPLIVRILEQLRSVGVSRVVVNLHHRAETITRVVGDGRHLGLEVRYSWEPVVLGSGGGPARALPLLASDRFFIVNGDTLAEVDLAALAEAHHAAGALATLAVAPADLARYNAILADDEHRWLGVAARGAAAEGLPGTPWHFVGIQAVNAAAFAGVAPTHPSETVRAIYPRLAAARPGAVRVHATTGAFFDIGTPADYVATVRRVAEAERRPIDRGADVVIDPSARVEDCILWDRVTVGAAARVTGCIVADDVAIPAGVEYHRQVITRDAIVSL
ncbi:MAG: NTP transferase domain-containing protein [Acidobacteria bacterium]|nr:NTP transferase domain-containing protein [Acidobacteriota bacterium]